MGDGLESKSEPGPEVVHVGFERRTVAAVIEDFRARIGDAVVGVGRVGIKVFLAVKTLVAPTEMSQRRPAVIVNFVVAW